MDDHEFEALRARLRDTARHAPPPDEDTHRWVRSLDTAGGSDRWFDAELYHAMQTEMCRRHGIPVSD